MKVYGIPGALAAFLALIPSLGYAQDAGKSGVVVAPGTIGVIWHASDRVAIRPDFSYSWSSTDATNNSAAKFRSNRFAIGVSGLFYFRTIEKLRLYVSPKLSYSRVHSTNDAASNPTSLQSSSTATTLQPSGMLGAQYSLHPRFAVYGEAGATYSTLTNKSEAPQLGLSSEQKGRAWGTVTTVGVIIYF